MKTLKALALFGPFILLTTGAAIAQEFLRSDHKMSGHQLPSSHQPAQPGDGSSYAPAPVAQGTNSYRSFSYDPGAMQTVQQGGIAPQYAPQRYSRPRSYAPFRADHKLRGIFN
jgi:hypothetical protein